MPGLGHTAGDPAETLGLWKAVLALGQAVEEAGARAELLCPHRAGLRKKSGEGKGGLQENEAVLAKRHTELWSRPGENVRCCGGGCARALRVIVGDNWGFPECSRPL